MVMLLEHLLHLLFRHTGNRFFSSRNHGLSKCQWKFEQKKTSGETPGSWILVNSPFTDKVMFSHNYAAYIHPLQKLQGPFRRKTHFRNQPTCRWFKTLSHPCYIMLTKGSFHPIDGEEKSQLKQLRYLKLFSWMLRLHQQYEFQTWIKVIWRTNICSKKLPCGVFGQMRSLCL